MKPQELAKRYPGLVGTGSRRDGVRRMYAAVTRNLNRWTHVLAAGRQEHVQAGQFRHDAAGRLLRAEATASHGETTVPASICEIELQSGHIRVTEHTATLPAAADESELRPQCVSNASQMRQEMTKNATTRMCRIGCSITKGTHDTRRTRHANPFTLWCGVES